MVVSSGGQRFQMCHMSPDDETLRMRRFDLVLRTTPAGLLPYLEHGERRIDSRLCKQNSHLQSTTKQQNGFNRIPRPQRNCYRIIHSFTHPSTFQPKMNISADTTEKMTVELDLRTLTEDDLASLKRSDPFLYYSIPAVYARPDSSTRILTTQSCWPRSTAHRREAVSSLARRNFQQSVTLRKSSKIYLTWTMKRSCLFAKHRTSSM